MSKWIAGHEFDTREQAEEWARSGHATYVIIEPWSDEQLDAMRHAISFLSDNAWNKSDYAAMRILSEMEDKWDRK